MNQRTQIMLAIAAVGMLVGTVLTIEVDFPYLEYSSDSVNSPTVSSESYDGITTAVSQFLWGYRGLDLISQSFVVMAAVICCLAMLKTHRRNE